jgi:hypothetical protein
MALLRPLERFWPPQAAAVGCGPGRVRLGSFSLDNVTAVEEWEERTCSPVRSLFRCAEPPSLGAPATRLRNFRIHRNSSGGGF